MLDSQARFELLKDHVRGTRTLESSMALLEWDQQTKLPAQGGAYRAEQLSFLAGEIHRRQTDPQLGEHLDALADSELANDPNSDSGATIRLLRRNFQKQSKLPQSLVEAMSRASSLGQQSWIEARREDDFSLFADRLEEIFNLKRQQADALGFEACRYDALLDEFEPGAKTSEVRQVLDDLLQELVPLVKAINESSVRPDESIVHRRFPIEAQEALGREASAAIGFDYQRGRLDVTHHPFCTGLGPNDCRITTRYDENFFNGSFFGTLHEAGHGIYEQGLRTEQYGFPPGDFCSLGIHESQSRMWENLVGRSHGFWKYFFPKAQQYFSESLGNVDLETFYAAINAVRPSLIRVEADEATYNLHIIIRFDLEQRLLDEEIRIADLPDAWHQRYQDYLGIRAPSDADGVLQDVHWGAGLVGYFPTYSLGNLFASQFFEAAESELGNLDKQFAVGDFHPLCQWLRDKIHAAGHCFSPSELCQRVTGKSLEHAPLVQHLQSKLGAIYGI